MQLQAVSVWHPSLYSSSRHRSGTFSPPAASAWRADTVQLSIPIKPAPINNPWTPALKIALMATPVAAGVGIGLARGGGVVGGLVGGALGAAVSIFGLWWHMTIGNPFERPSSGPELPPPPKPY